MRSVISDNLGLIQTLKNGGDGKLRANSSSAEDLTLIRGIGPATAGKLIRIREYLGPFRTTQDLRLVPGIGINRLPEIEKQLTVEAK